MKISSIREVPGMQSVLHMPTQNGPNPAYWVFSNIQHSKWENMTVIAPGNFSGEYNKTYGHYHTKSLALETCRLVHGSGIFMLQQKYYENNIWQPARVSAVYLVQASFPDEEIIVPSDYGHSWSNLGDTPLITFDDWRDGHADSDYEPITNQKGMAFYLLNKNGTAEIVPNPLYKNLPIPQWLSASEFNALDYK